MFHCTEDTFSGEQVLGSKPFLATLRFEDVPFRNETCIVRKLQKNWNKNDVWKKTFINLNVKRALSLILMHKLFDTNGVCVCV